MKNETSKVNSKKERIIKDPEIRKNEIIQAAQKLFFSQGYENTPITDILHATGIAKGTFYHYFKSKDELLSEMVNMVATAAIQQIQKIIEMPITPLEKLNRSFQNSQNIKVENLETMKASYEALYKEENIKLRVKINEQIIQDTVPFFGNIIEEGIKLGDFKRLDPDQEADSLAEAIMALAIHMGSKNAHLFISEDPDIAKKLEKNILYFEKSVERLLDLQPGSFHTVEPKTLKLMIKGLSKKSGNKQIEGEHND
ncbi:MAG: TetR/AcrR family transcriptional regulator [Leptospirales bacterium]